NRGWVVLVAGLVGSVIALRWSWAIPGSALVLIAGAAASVSAAGTREAIGHACPDLGGGMGGNVLGIFCLEPSVGWRLQLATVGSLGMFVAGALLLSFVTFGPLARRPRTRSARDAFKKYGPP